jgi:Zn-dependent protease
MALARVGQLLHVDDLVDLCGQWAGLSLMLCFFNLIPIPPLDGSQVVRCLTNMSYETYAKLARFGIFAIILVLNIPIIRDTLQTVTSLTLVLLARLFGVA